MCFSQEAVHNYGNLQFHETAQVGFHIDLINDGMFDKNLGLAGFYSIDPLTVSGSINPVFHDIEVVTDNGLFLQTTLGVTNNVNFVLGNIKTEKSSSDSYLNFVDKAFYVGAGNLTHVDGYAGASNKELITFPVGDGERLRNLTIASVNTNETVKCAYFHENPNNPISLNQQFDTSLKATFELQINEAEFWRLESNQPSVVTLSWDEESNIDQLAESALNLLVVGWNKTENQWESLGNSAITGNLEEGNITSEIFLPNDYEIITLGGTNDLLEPFSVESKNYFLSPNNDGINDFLAINGVENMPNNILNIYNRYGVLVYSKTNYINEFNGRSNRKVVINRSSGLPSGVYFYILTNDSNERVQGYIYIAN